MSDVERTLGRLEAGMDGLKEVIVGKDGILERMGALEKQMREQREERAKQNGIYLGAVAVVGFLGGIVGKFFG